MRTIKSDIAIMNLLKVSEISRIICDTNMGTLKLRLRKGETAYRFVLDAVELPKDLNKELMELIYPPKVEPHASHTETITTTDLIVNGIPVKTTSRTMKSPDDAGFENKHKGRPRGSKNKDVKRKDKKSLPAGRKEIPTL